MIGTMKVHCDLITPASVSYLKKPILDKIWIARSDLLKTDDQTPLICTLNVYTHIFSTHIDGTLNL